MHFNKSILATLLALVAIGAMTFMTLQATSDPQEASTMPTTNPDSSTRPADESEGNPQTQPANGQALATFGAGCFWGVEATFRDTPGVVDTEVGFSGGRVPNPSYRRVCGGDTGHAEVVRVIYDPKKVSYEKLLAVFFSAHDPTQVNRQGPDVGDQYRSVIFTHTDRQQELARAAKQRLDAAGRYRRPIATQVEPAKPFWRAEEYHQRYLEKSGRVCH